MPGRTVCVEVATTPRRAACPEPKERRKHSKECAWSAQTVWRSPRAGKKAVVTRHYYAHNRYRRAQRGGATIVAGTRGGAGDELPTTQALPTRTSKTRAAAASSPLSVSENCSSRCDATCDASCPSLIVNRPSAEVGFFFSFFLFFWLSRPHLRACALSGQWAMGNDWGEEGVGVAAVQTSATRAGQR